MSLVNKIVDGTSAGIGLITMVAGDVLQSIPNTTGGLVDILPDFGSTLCLTSLCNLSSKLHPVNNALYATSYYFLIEFSQKLDIIPGIYDPKDFLGYISGSLTATLLHYVSNIKPKNSKALT